MIARKGIAGASMQAIAREARVAKGTLYLYFRDRDELIDHSAARVFDELLARVEAVLARPAPLREAVRALVQTKIEFFDVNREFLRVYTELHAPDGAGCGRAGRAQYARYVHLLSALLAEAVRKGEMKPFEPAKVALFIAEGMGAIVERRLEERGRKTVEDVEWVVELLLDGLTARERL